MGPRRRPGVAGTTIPRVEALIAERLVSQLRAIWEHRLGLVVAPPGAGKSTLLASFAAALDAPVAWYQADRWDTSEAALMRRLASVFDAVIDGGCASPSSIDELMERVADIPGERVLLIIDDLHALEASPAEMAIERIVARGPAKLHILAASRSQPGFNLSRLRVAGDLLEIGADELRFRTWEVEELFRDFYGDPMLPVELARLARWTEGWAAGLQLFHLATHGRPASERRRVLRSLGPSSRLAREYLAQNALASARDEIRIFLVETSVLSRLSGPLCDRLLGRSGSEGLLEELVRRCLFTTRDDVDGSYRYHEVFRSHLQGVLVAEAGEDHARSRFSRAGDLLLADGAPADALEAYVRAEAWEVVEQVLGSEGQAIAEGPLRWLSIDAQQSLREDAWLGLAGARRLRGEGRFQEAVEAYAVVQRSTGTEAASHAARRERTVLLAWLAPDMIRPPGPAGNWWTLLRRGLLKDPAAVAAEAARSDDASSRLVAGVCLLLAGDVRAARDELSAVTERSDAEGLVACVAQLVRGTAALLAGDQEGVVDLNGAIGAAEGLGWEWLARVGRSLLSLSGRRDHLSEAARLREMAAAHEDRWGEAMAALAQAWGSVMAGPVRGPQLDWPEMVAVASAARDGFRVLGAPVMQAWAGALVALGAASNASGDTMQDVLEARHSARETRVDAADLVARLAAAKYEADTAAAQAACERLVEHHGIDIGAVAAPVVRNDTSVPASSAGLATAPGPPALLRLLGAFELRIGGDVIDTAAIRPRVRTLLYLLASQVGAPMHREVISENLWPDAEPTASARNLHVAVASLRRVLEPRATRGGFRLVLRDGENYLLSLPPAAEVDVVGFEAAAAEARLAAAREDLPAVARWCRSALDRYAGDLLPEAGPADWVLARRDALRRGSVQVAELLARTLLQQGDSAASAAVCSAALERDRYHDPLWRTLIEAREASGDRAAARTARNGYRLALAELGVDPTGAAV